MQVAVIGGMPTSDEEEGGGEGVSTDMRVWGGKKAGSLNKCTDVQVALQYEELLACIFHHILAQVLDEECDSGRPAILVRGRKGERMTTLISEEHLEAASITISQPISVASSSRGLRKGGSGEIVHV